MERSGGADKGGKDDKKRLLLLDGKKKRKLQESKMNDPSDYGVVVTPEVPKPAPRITAGTAGGVRKKKRKGKQLSLVDGKKKRQLQESKMGDTGEYGVPDVQAAGGPMSCPALGGLSYDDDFFDDDDDGGGSPLTPPKCPSEPNRGGIPRSCPKRPNEDEEDEGGGTPRTLPKCPSEPTRGGIPRSRPVRPNEDVPHRYPSMPDHRGIDAYGRRHPIWKDENGKTWVRYDTK